MDTFKNYVEAHRERFVAELQDFCRQPSVVAQNLGIKEMALKVMARFQKLGAETRLIPVAGGSPVVFAEIGSGDRVLMVYNHYDVQPPEPLDLWETGPWEAAIRDGKLFARGVADNKGDLLCRIQAVEAYLASIGKLPLKIRFVVEGEEEIGSIHLPQFVQENHTLLEGAEGCLWEFGAKDSDDRPQISCGMKGILYVELWAHGAANDLHSSLAAIVVDPAWRLTWALATLKSADDRILIDGFMDSVRPPTRAETDALKTIPFDEQKIKADYGISGFINNLTGVELLTKYLYEPTCTICGLYSGYVGEGCKTVLPNRAFAKLDFRLVPDLTPDLVKDLLKRHLARRGFDDIEVKLTGTELEVARSPLNSPITRAAISAMKAVCPNEPVIYPTLAGGGPMYTLCQAWGIPAVSTGCAWHDSRVHAPNENIRIGDYFEGMSFVRELIDRFATV